MMKVDSSFVFNASILVLCSMATSACSSSDNQNSVSDTELGTTNTVPTTIELDANANEIIIKLAGYQSEQLSVLIDELGSEIANQSTSEQLPDGQFITELTGFDPITTNINRQLFSCPGGGTFLREVGQLDDFMRQRTVGAYLFNQCVFSTELLELTSQEYEINGAYNVDLLFLTMSRSFFNQNTVDWDDFSVTSTVLSDEGLSYAITGDTTFLHTNGSGSPDTRERSVNIASYRKESRGNVEEMSDVEFSLFNSSSTSNTIFSTSLQIAGIYKGNLSNDVSVSVNTIVPFERERAVGPSIDSNIPLVGEMELMADNNANLFISATPQGNPEFGTAHVAYNYTNSIGENSESDLENFMLVFPGWAPDCSVHEDVETGIAVCIDGESFVRP